MDEEKLFKTVYIASRVAVMAEDGMPHNFAVKVASEDVESAWKELEEYRGSAGQFVEIDWRHEPQWCGLCDSQHCTGHPLLKCRKCGAEGLAENMTTERHKCKDVSPD